MRSSLIARFGEEGTSILEDLLISSQEQEDLPSVGETCPRLLRLTLYGSRLKSLRTLGTRLSMLVMLDVSKCGLVGLECLSYMPRLTVFLASQNAIDDLTPLAANDVLACVDFRENALKDLSYSLSILSSLGALRHVRMSKNPMCEISASSSVYEEELRDAFLGSTITHVDDFSIVGGSTGLTLITTSCTTGVIRCCGLAAVVGEDTLPFSERPCVATTVALPYALETVGSRSGGEIPPSLLLENSTNSSSNSSSSSSSSCISRGTGASTATYDEADSFFVDDFARPVTAETSAWSLGSSSIVLDEQNSTTRVSTPSETLSALTSDSFLLVGSPAKALMRQRHGNSTTETTSIKRGLQSTLNDVIPNSSTSSAKSSSSASNESMSGTSSPAIGELCGHSNGKESHRDVNAALAAIQGAKDASSLSDEHLVTILRCKPRYVPTIATRQGFRKFFSPLTSAHLEYLLMQANADAPTAQDQKARVQRRLDLMGRS